MKMPSDDSPISGWWEQRLLQNRSPPQGSGYRVRASSGGRPEMHEASRRGWVASPDPGSRRARGKSEAARGMLEVVRCAGLGVGGPSSRCGRPD